MGASEPSAGEHAALQEARLFEEDLVEFLRDMIAIPAESCHEEERCRRVLAEYEALGCFDEVYFDPLGSVVARVGSGPLTILMDGHIDTVGVGNPAAWKHDPFLGNVDNGEVWGRGAIDELPGVACMAYGAKLMAQRGMPEDVTLYLTATVMEEDCDGLALGHLIEQQGLRPDVVILGEPTNMAVYRGHRGRLEASITTRGVSAHGAHSEYGENALYRMAPILLDIEDLNRNLATDPFLGQGSVVVSDLTCTTASRNAVPDLATAYLDRRLTAGETVASAMAEFRALPNLADAEVELLTYEAKTWRGEQVGQDKYFPTWVLEADHPLVTGMATAVQQVLGQRPEISRWAFSTNGVASMGRLGIPTVGFAPGREELSHSTEERVAIEDLVRAVAVYSLIPKTLSEQRHGLSR